MATFDLKKHYKVKGADKIAEVDNNGQIEILGEISKQLNSLCISHVLETKRITIDVIGMSQDDIIKNMGKLNTLYIEYGDSLVVPTFVEDKIVLGFAHAVDVYKN